MPSSCACAPDWNDAPLFGRRRTILATLRRLNKVNPGSVCIVESGTIRDESYIGLHGDGWSTVAWGWYCSQVNGRAYTVDADSVALGRSRRITEPFSKSIEYVLSNSVTFLEEWPHRHAAKIDLLYLDSLDYLDPEASEFHSLEEAAAALPSLATNCLVLLDDTVISGESPKQSALSIAGKGARSIPFLLNNGFQLAWAIEQQVLVYR